MHYNSFFYQSQKNILIIEYKDELETFFNFNAEQLTCCNYDILALDPKAQVILKKKKLNFYKSSFFLSKDDHEDILIKSNEIIKVIRKNLFIKDNMELIDSYKNTIIFYLRCFLNYIFFLISIIDNVRKKVSPKVIIVPTIVGLKSHEEYLTKDDRLLGLVVKNYLEDTKSNISLQFFSCNVNFQSPYFLSNNLSKLFFKRHIKAFLFRIFLINLFKLKRFFVGIQDSPLVLGISSQYNMNDIFSQIKYNYNTWSLFLSSSNIINDFKKIMGDRYFFSFLSLIEEANRRGMHSFDSIKLQLKTVINTLESLDKKSSLFIFRGVSVFPFIKLFWENNLTILAQRLLGFSQCLSMLLDIVSPNLIISQFGMGIGHILGELALKKKIPAIFITHGSHVPPKNCFEKIEWGEHGKGLLNSGYEYIALQTPWAERYLEHFPTRSKPIKTGPLIFAKRFSAVKDKGAERKRLLGANALKKRFVFIHAGTPKFYNALRFYVYETVDEYIRNINFLIDSIQKRDDVYLIIRFRPSSVLDTKTLKTLLTPSDCYDIYTQGSFEEYLMISDLLISYSSTTIEEALQNKIPVLQFDPDGKYMHIPCVTLKKGSGFTVDSCYFVPSIDNLDWSIEQIITRHLKVKDNLPSDIWKRHFFDEKEKIDFIEFCGQFLRKKT